MQSKSLLKDIIIGVLVDFVVTGLITLLTFTIDKFELNFKWLCIFFGLIIVIEIIVFTILIIYRNKSYKSYYYPKKSISYKYSYDKVEISYVLKKVEKEGKTDYKLDLSRKVIVRSNSYSLESINDKYLWTGRCDAKTPEAVSNIKQIRRAEEKPGVWKYLEIFFKNKISNNETIELEYKWPTIDDCTSSSPFISTSTDIPIKEIKFILDFGIEYANKKVYLEERRSMDGENMIEHKEYDLNEKGCYTIVLTPHRFRYFLVYWYWNDSCYSKKGKKRKKN